MNRIFILLLLGLTGCAGTVTGLAGGSIPGSVSGSSSRAILYLIDAGYNPQEDVTYCFYTRDFAQTLDGKVTCPSTYWYNNR